MTIDILNTDDLNIDMLQNSTTKIPNPIDKSAGKLINWIGHIHFYRFILYRLILLQL